VVVGSVVLLVAGMLSYSLFDFAPGAWLAFGIVMLGAVSWLFARLPFVPDWFGFGDD
jgi:hypothetical protein